MSTKVDLALDPDPYVTPLLLATHGGTISHQTGQSYSQFVEVGKPDAARSILPPGQAEGDLEFPAHQQDQAAIWAIGSLRGSPTSLSAIQGLGAWTKETLSYAGVP